MNVSWWWNICARSGEASLSLVMSTISTVCQRETAFRIRKKSDRTPMTSCWFPSLFGWDVSDRHVQTPPVCLSGKGSIHGLVRGDEYRYIVLLPSSGHLRRDVTYSSRICPLLHPVHLPQDVDPIPGCGFAHPCVRSWMTNPTPFGGREHLRTAGAMCGVQCRVANCVSQTIGAAVGIVI